jgi:hypothetical protein
VRDQHLPRTEFTRAERLTLRQLAAVVMARLDTLRSASYMDSLTALPNRSRLDADLQELAAFGPEGRLPGKLTAVAVDICDRIYLRDMIKALGWDYVEGFLIQAMDQLRQALGRLRSIASAPPPSPTWSAGIAGSPRSSGRARLAGTVEHQGIPHRCRFQSGSCPWPSAVKSVNWCLRC